MIFQGTTIKACFVHKEKIHYLLLEYFMRECGKRNKFKFLGITSQSEP